MSRARLLAAAFAAVALFGAAPAVAQLRIDLERGADVRLDTAAVPDVPVRGTVMRVGGNGSTIIIWPIAAARGSGGGTTVIVWARAAARVDGGGTTIVVWPRAVAPEVETGDAVADLAPIEVRAERDSAWTQPGSDPEPDADVRLATAAAPDESVRGNGNTVVIWPRTAARVGINTIVVWPRDAARVSGNGSTVVVWPRTAPRVGGNGSTVIIWPRTAAPGVETDVADLASIEIRDERDR